MNATARERVAVLGGTGFIGSRLVPALVESGARVRVGARRVPQRHGAAARSDSASPEFVRCDLESGQGLDAALEGVDVGYFLVHGMAEGRGFESRELRAVDNFARAARRHGIQRVIYLGGLYPEGQLSSHLESRRQVGLRLIESTGALVVRAGLIVGNGGASFEIMYALSRRLPLMIAPRWLGSRCQPVSIADTILGLVHAPEVPASREVDLVGPEVLTYRRMLEITADEINGREPLVMPVPVLSPELSAHWLRFVTRTDMNVARSLISSLRHDLVAGRPLLASELGYQPVGFREGVRTALVERASAQPTAS